jgi:uncharacterized protein with FMN-binding domain
MLQAAKRSRVSAFLFCMLPLAAAVGCDKDDPSLYNPSPYKAGVYTAEAAGYGGFIKVSVTFSEEEITRITIVSHKETITANANDPERDEKEENIIPKVQEALAEIPPRIVAAQSANVDVVSGATATSQGIIIAVKRCIKLAGS